LRGLQRRPDTLHHAHSGGREPGFFGFSYYQITVQYAGPAPFEVAGVSQINFTGIDAGYPMTLEVGQSSSTVRLYVAP